MPFEVNSGFLEAILPCGTKPGIHVCLLVQEPVAFCNEFRSSGLTLRLETDVLVGANLIFCLLEPTSSNFGILFFSKVRSLIYAFWNQLGP